MLVDDLQQAIPAAVDGRVESVLVIGAGVSGLVAARALQRAGVPVTVLEGRDREPIVGRRVSPTEWTVSSWTRDPCSMGCYSGPSNTTQDQEHLRDALAAPHRRVLFAAVDL